MRKIVLCLFALLIAGSILCNTAAASAASASVSASVSTAVHGDSIVFTVSIKGCDAATSIGIIPSYDSGVFELSGGKWLVSGALLSDFSGGVATIAYDASRAFNEAVFQFTLKVKDSAALGSHSVSCEVVVNNLSDSVYSGTVSAKVEITCAHSYSAWSSAGDSTHSRTCSKCGTAETLDHSFTNACDESCDTCGYTRSITHSYSGAWSTDGQSHWHECTVCKAKADNENHSFDNACDISCSVCGYERSISHSYGNWTKDDSSHSRECSVCHVRDSGRHNYSNGCDSSCNSCGYSRDTQHSYMDSWSMDDTQHYHECTACGDRIDEAAHVPGPEATETTAQVCTVCNLVLAAPQGHTHSYSSAWTYDEASHWKACTCGDRTDVGSHSWSEGIVTLEPTYESDGVTTYTCTICETVKTEPIEQLIPPTTEPTPTTAPTETTLPAETTEPDGNQDTDGDHVCAFPWWTVVVMVLEAAVIVWLLIIIGKLQKRK